VAFDGRESVQLLGVSQVPYSGPGLCRTECLSSVSTTPAINSCQGFSVIAGVVDTSDKFLIGEQLSPVTTTPAINLSPVTTTPALNLLLVTRTRTSWRRGAAKDRRKVEGDNLVISPATEVRHGRRWCHWKRHEKSYIHRHPTHPDQRPLMPPKLKIIVLVEVVLTASGASDQGV
jgi:hypothetical protein